MDFAGFAFAVLLIELTPGPNMAWLVALSLSEGRRAAFAAVAGVAVGLTLNAILSSFGLSIVLTAYPNSARWIGFAGAAMMIWLAWHAWHDDGESSTGQVPSKQTRKHFIIGLLLNLVNVKAALFLVTVAPQFLTAVPASMADILLLAMIAVVIATIIHLALVIGADHARQALAKPGRTRIVSRSLAALMLAVAGWFAWGALA